MEDIKTIEATPAKDLPACPVETTLMLIGDKWKVLILRDLMPGTKRFGELKKSIGHVSQKVLTAQLRDMEASDLVNRKVYADGQQEDSLSKLPVPSPSELRYAFVQDFYIMPLRTLLLPDQRSDSFQTP